jgi:hypothetical protein
MFEYTEIISAIIAALTAGGWLVSRHKRAQENEEHKTKIEAMEAKITASLRDSETKYTREALEIYTDNVVKPLRDEVRALRENQIRFQAAINAAPTCHLFPDCVVIRRLRSAPNDNHRDTEHLEDLDGHDDFDPCQ